MSTTEKTVKEETTEMELDEEQEDERVNCGECGRVYPKGRKRKLEKKEKKPRNPNMKRKPNPFILFFVDWMKTHNADKKYTAPEAAKLAAVEYRTHKASIERSC